MRGNIELFAMPHKVKKCMLYNLVPIQNIIGFPSRAYKKKINYLPTREQPIYW